MNTKVVSIRLDDTLDKVARIFTDKNIHGAPVVDDNKKLVGIVTEADILRLLRRKSIDYDMVYPSIHQYGVVFEQKKKTEITDAFKKLSETKVKDFMTKNVEYATPDDNVSDIIKKMIKYNINRMPVVENETVVGIITRGDILKGMVKNSIEHD